MDIFSPIFFGFFLLVVVLYYSLPGKFQQAILFLSSSVFIGLFSVKFLLYTYLFVLINYGAGYLLERNAQKPRLKKLIYQSGIFLNIGSLVFFKYINFLLSIIVDVDHLFSGNLEISALNILIPLGISYYTFQGIGYLIQMNRGLEKFEGNMLIFTNYFIFFPKFLAGPIEQSKNFLPQLRGIKVFQNEDVIHGLRLILWGAFKKLVIADRLALVINGVYPNVDQVSGNVFLMTFLLQPLHLYCDFSGYTDIALGIGRAFGFKLTDNFRRPFFSTSVTEFWQRWHISLSSWCNEFIFKRLTFKHRRRGLWAPAYAVFVTFFVIGIWHGPRWNFIILGVLQGLAINYEFFTKKWRLSTGQKFPRQLVRYFSYLMVYLFIGLTLVFFNSQTVSDALYFISHLFTELNLQDFSLIYLYNFDKGVVAISLFIVLLVEFRQENYGKNVLEEVVGWPKWARYGFYYVICFVLIYLGSPDQNFVYMQF